MAPATSALTAVTSANSRVLQTLHGFGACAEVISHYELWLALQLCVAPEMVIFNGPAKTDAAVELAVSRGIRIINVDGLPEIDRIAAVAARYGRRQGVGVRVTTSVGWSSRHVAARQSVLTPCVIASYTRPTPIEIRVDRKRFSCTADPSYAHTSHLIRQQAVPSQPTVAARLGAPFRFRSGAWLQRPLASIDALL
jgi:hypothetical protein